MKDEDVDFDRLHMSTVEFEKLKRDVALEMCRIALSTADFSLGMDLLTEEQHHWYCWLEALYYDGEITYGQLWERCPKIPLPR